MRSARLTRTSSLMLIALGAIMPLAMAQQGARDGEWREFAGDKGSTKYSPLDQITRENFSSLEIAWQWESIDAEVMASGEFRMRPGAFKTTPIMANGVIYVGTSLSQVAAIDAGTGETIWQYDPGSWRAGRPANIGFIHRGAAYWSSGDEERIFMPTGDSRLIALDAKTGKPIPSFGNEGMVDLSKGLNQVARLYMHQVNSPPIICRDVVIVGSVIFDRPSTKESVRGDIRGYDVRTGKKLWQFHSIPQEGEFGIETWENDAWKYTGGTNVWTVMSADEELGYVYLPFGAPTNDFYGGHRPGDNLYANSLVCLNAETGERVWHFQTVHHDLWDYDLPCAPNLVDIVVDGKPIKAVAQMGKTGMCYVFDRVTGEPVWPIPEVPVPQSTVAGEKTSPTQPIPTKPPAFSAQGLEDNLIDFTPELRQEALDLIKDYDYGPMFTPPSVRGALAVPGDGGGANWTGAAFDPETSLIYVSSTSYVSLLQLIEPDPNRSNMKYLIGGNIGGAPRPSGLPLVKPPYCRITAIDLNTGTHAWMKPMGRGRFQDHALLKDLDIAPTGDGGWTFPLATKTLLIGGHNATLLAMDKATGELIGEKELKDADGKVIGYVTGAPATYMHKGKQYIAVAVSARESKAYILGLALP